MQALLNATSLDLLKMKPINNILSTILRETERVLSIKRHRGKGKGRSLSVLRMIHTLPGLLSPRRRDLMSLSSSLIEKRSKLSPSAFVIERGEILLCIPMDMLDVVMFDGAVTCLWYLSVT